MVLVLVPVWCLTQAGLASEISALYAALRKVESNFFLFVSFYSVFCTQYDVRSILF